MRIPLTPLFALAAIMSAASCAVPANEDNAAANEKKDVAAKPQKTAPTKSTPSEAVPFGYDEMVDTEKSNLEEAFEAAFNVPAGQTGETSATIKSDETNTIFKPVALYRINEKQWALLSGGQSDNEGHAATGTNALHYLDPAEGGWQSTTELFGFGSTGTFGNPATEWKFTRSLGKNPYLLTSAGGTWQGCSVSTTTLTELTPAGPVDRGDFVDFNGLANELAGKDFNYEGTIISAVPDKSFTVRYEGTKAADVTFVREGDKYVPTSKVPVEGC